MGRTIGLWTVLPMALISGAPLSSAAATPLHVATVDQRSVQQLLLARGFPPLVLLLPIGDDVVLSVVTQSPNPKITEELEAGYRASQRLGYLTLSKHQANMFGNSVEAYDIHPTPLGLRYGFVRQRLGAGYTTQYVLRLAQRLPAQVTIRAPDPDHRLIAFKYRLSGDLPIFKALVPGGDDRLRDGSATVVHDPEGWRLDTMSIDVTF